ncbi:MAG: hypothetical protein ACR2NZ_13485 [Rubripirellula sp.]
MILRLFALSILFALANRLIAEEKSVPEAGDDQPALAVFEQRIMPIFRSPKPSSCIQCHLASVDLRDYILPSHEETFLSLLDQGLIDMQNPDASKILKLIRMGDDDPDAMSKRIHAKARAAELEAFTAWIKASCADERLTDERVDRQPAIARPKRSNEVIRHARKDRVLDSFIRNVWSQRMRCFPCHTPGEIDPTNPQHVKPRERQQEMVAKYGARMNLFKESPLQTMKSMLAGSHSPTKKSLPLLNFESPSESLLLLKPTAKLPPKRDDGTFEPPSALLPVSHMGGLKMHVNDMSYKAILGWIEDVSKVRGDAYASVDELPLDNWWPTQKVIRLKDVPEAWPRGGLVQIFVYPADADTKMAPIGFTQSIVTPRGMINGPITLFGDRDEDSSDPDLRLQPGRYSFRVFLDQDGMLKEQPGALLDAGTPDGEFEFDAQWKDGFKNAVVISAGEVLASGDEKSGD